MLLALWLEPSGHRLEEARGQERPVTQISPLLDGNSKVGITENTLGHTLGRQAETRTLN